VGRDGVAVAWAPHAMLEGRAAEEAEAEAAEGVTDTRDRRDAPP
jgi:hypothetical protein